MSYTKCIEEAIEFASKKENLIEDTEIIKLLHFPPHAMSTRHSQLLFNRLCSTLKDKTNYLEVGIFRGSSFFSAAYNNTGNFYGVDDFSKYCRNSKKGGKHSYDTESKALNHINKYIKKLSSDNTKINFINHDCWDIEHLRNNLKDKIDIFFYDGDHSYESQSKILSHFSEFLADEIILIIDDYFCESIIKNVQDGTQHAIKNSDFNIVKEFTLKNKKLDKNAKYSERQEANLWHNGFYIAHLKR